MPLTIRPSAHVELFHRDERTGKSTLQHSSRPDEFLTRPCKHCGRPLGFKEPAALVSGGHAHESCARHA